MTVRATIDKCPDTSNQLWQSTGFGTLPYQGTADSPASFSEVEADRLARQRFIGNYRQMRTGFQTGVFLGELAESVRMLANPARALRNGVDSYYRDVKKRLKREKNRNKRRKIPADTWLEYSFGWAPLVNDAKAAAELLTKDPMGEYQYISGRDSQKWTSNPDNSSHYQFYLCHFRVRSRSQNEVSIRYQGAAGAENNPPAFPEVMGLSWSNVLPTVWELIPYSFLIDYFSNVGKVIEGASTGRVFLSWGCKTIRKTAELHCEAYTLASENLGFPKEKWRYTATSSGTQSSFKNIARHKVNAVDYGLADTTFKLPGTGLKWLNIAALADMRR